MYSEVHRYGKGEGRGKDVPVLNQLPCHEDVPCS